MTFKYEELEVWRLAKDLVKGSYRRFRSFPSFEQFALAAQGRRAVTSIALNIAEGSGRQTDRDFALFINRAVTSLQETDAVLKIAVELGYLTQDSYDSLAPLIEKEYFKLVAFEKALRGRSLTRTRQSGSGSNRGS